MAERMRVDGARSQKINDEREEAAVAIARRYWKVLTAAASNWPARFRQRKCLFADPVGTCSARQLRNGLLLINCLAWVLIFYGLISLVT
jgi:hypothetical protein